MKMTRSSRWVSPALAVVFSLGAVLPITAGEVLLEGGNFDDSIAGWYWEDWSAPGSSVAHDAALDSNNSASSGSLRLNSTFVAGNPDWQQAVYTLPLPAEINMGESYNTLSFDVRVDPASAMRFEGDYGSIQVILRNGSNWDWAELGFKALTSTEWTRVTTRFSEATAAIDAVRAITLRVAQNGMQGPVMVNVDNFVFTEEEVIDALNNGTADLPPSGWVWEDWSAPGSTVTWDPTDYYGRATSGSARLVHNFLDQDGYQQAVFTMQLPAEVDAATEYSHINLDVKVDPSSTPRGAGDYGFFEIFLRNGSSWTWVPTGPAETTGTRLTSTEWTHISMPVRSGEQVHRITFKLGENNFDGPVTLLIDNLTWTKNTAPPPPPSLELARGQSGLNLVATGAGQYDRHNIYAADNGTLGWYDAPEPVTYEFSLLDFPAAEDYAGFQAHVFLVPGFPGTANSPDWNEPSLIFLDIKAGEGGTGNATFRWKTNQPGGNSQLYAGGLSNVTSSTVLGTWKITASQNNHFTVTAPDGSTTDVELPAEAAAQFAGSIRLYVGVQPNTTPNIGQGALVGHVKVTQGSTVLLEDDFTGETLDEFKWVMNGPAGGVQYVAPGDAGWLISWGIPDSGFYLQMAPSLSNPDWTGVPVTPNNLGPLLRQAHVPGSGLPEDMAFFRLVKPELVAPADHTALADYTYTLTDAQGGTWTFLLTPFDETSGTYYLEPTGQTPDSGNYVVTADLSNNQWNIELTSFGGGPVQMGTLQFATPTSGTWSLTAGATSASGTFEAAPLQ